MSRDAKRCNIDAADTKVAQLFPHCPSYLRGEARLLWASVTRALVVAGDWDDYDATELVAAAYCCYASALQSAIAHVSEHGAVIPADRTAVAQHSPYVRAMHLASEGLLKHAELLNLSPQNREYRQQRQQQVERKRVFDETGRWPP
jgi:phage terminase small subunit